MKRISLFIPILVLSISVVSGRDFSYKEEDIAVVIGSRVNVRASMSLKAQVIYQAKEGEYVKVLQWTDRRLKVGKLDDYWVKIKTKSGTVGYLYGAYLFDLHSLYNPRGWHQNVCSSYSNVLNLRDDRSYSSITESANTDTGETDETVEEGTYSVSGRKLTLSKGKKFYLFRHKMVNWLTREKLPVNTKTFSTYCNAQWKEYVEEY
jgi:hypothetical protein